MRDAPVPIEPRDDGTWILRCPECLRRNRARKINDLALAEFCGPLDRPCPRCDLREMAAAEARGGDDHAA